MIPFPLTADLEDGDVQQALTELANDLAVMLSEAPIHHLDLTRLALALCCVIPGSAACDVVLHCSQYFLDPDPAEPIVMIVQVHSSEGVTDLEWPICPPLYYWASEAEQHSAAEAFMDSLCR